jgi:hypothetical protein
LDPELFLNNSDDIDENDIFDESILSSDDNKMKRYRSIIIPFSMEDTRKKSYDSVIENIVSITIDGMIFLTISIKEIVLMISDIRFDQYIQIINQMRKDGLLGDDSYFQILQIFMEKERYTTLFYTMISDLRLD